MITLFRRMREKLIQSGSVSKYLLYALGEILLVVVGILIALQINNWNEERKQSQLMQKYYAEMHDELSEIYSSMKFRIEGDSLLLVDIERSLRIIDNANPDSLPMLEQTLGAVGTAGTTEYSMPVTDEFINNGYLKNADQDSLKQFLRYLKINVDLQHSYNNYIDDQYQLKIEPFFNKNINYSQVINRDYKEMVYEGGPPTDFTKLVNNLEAWNVITFKYETTKGSFLWRKNMRDILQSTLKQLEKALL